MAIPRSTFVALCAGFAAALAASYPTDARACGCTAPAQSATNVDLGIAIED